MESLIAGLVFVLGFWLFVGGCYLGFLVGGPMGMVLTACSLIVFCIGASGA